MWMMKVYHLLVNGKVWAHIMHRELQVEAMESLVEHGYFTMMERTIGKVIIRMIILIRNVGNGIIMRKILYL